jgi:VWFA-related protein
VNPETSRRPGTKAATIAKITSKTNWAFFVAFVTFVIFVAPSWRVSPQGQQQSTQRPPVFRGGATYVSVDTYPTIEGRIVEGLSRDDLQIFEDGKPQTIATFEFVRADTRPPDDERAAHLSAREGLELAADPRYRVIVIVLDRTGLDSAGWTSTREALRTFLRSEVEPRDLLALMTTDDSWQDIFLGRRLADIERALDDPEFLRPRPQEISVALQACEFGPLRGRIRADATYEMLEGLVRLLGQVREDRSSVLFVSAGVSQAPPDRRGYQDRRPLPLPKMGLVNGRIQPMRSATEMNDRFCKAEGQRLAEMNFDARFSELTKLARASNVAFYPVPVVFTRPLRLVGFAEGMTGGWDRGGRSTGLGMAMRPSESLTDLARHTGGAVTKPGDVSEGLRRLTGDTGSHYLIGYYTTNPKRDGKMRSIKVRLKNTGGEVRARRQYRAPSEDDIEDLSKPAGPVVRIVPEAIMNALEPLKAVRASTQFFVYGAVAGHTLTVTVEVPTLAVETGRWSDGAALDLIAEAPDGRTVGIARGRLGANGRALVAVPLDGSGPPTELLVRLRADGESIAQRVRVGGSPSTLVGDPQVYRSSQRGVNTPVASFMFARDERVRLDWPVFKALDRYEARLIDRFGLPLRTRVKVEPQDVGVNQRLVSEISLAPLGRGDYLIELTAAAGVVSETRLLAIRVK